MSVYFVFQAFNIWDAENLQRMRQTALTQCDTIITPLSPGNLDTMPPLLVNEDSAPIDCQVSYPVVEEQCYQCRSATHGFLPSVPTLIRDTVDRIPVDTVIPCSRDPRVNTIADDFQTELISDTAVTENMSANHCNDTVMSEDCSENTVTDYGGIPGRGAEGEGLLAPSGNKMAPSPSNSPIIATSIRKNTTASNDGSHLEECKPLISIPNMCSSTNNNT